MERFDSVADATEAAIAAATHLTEMDSGAVAVLRDLAITIDALADGDAQASDKAKADGKAKFDNVSVPTYLKFCDSLGLTPAGRMRLAEKKEPAGGKLAQLRQVSGGRSA